MEAIAPNLLEQTFVATRPNQVWLADITYVPTVEGWLYLAVVPDLFSRKIVGGRCVATCERNSIAALTMAIQRQKPLLWNHENRTCFTRSAIQHATPPGTTCSSTSKDTTIVSGSIPHSGIEQAARQAA
jgi:transposase InsO family protein